MGPRITKIIQAILFCNALLSLFGVPNGYGDVQTSLTSEVVGNVDGWSVDPRTIQLLSDIDALKESLNSSRKITAAWSDNAAESNAEAEVFRRKYESLNLRAEALGLARSKTNESFLEEKVLESIHELDSIREERNRLATKLTELAEGAMNFMKIGSLSSESSLLAKIESCLQQDNSQKYQTKIIPSTTASIASDLRSGVVIGYRKDLSLVVSNLGYNDGIKSGMVFSITRGDEVVGYARVVQVRSRFSGAVFQAEGSFKDQVKTGDHIQVVSKL